jgi:hypothetical protein
VPAGIFAPVRQRDAGLWRNAVFWGVAYAYLVTMLGTTFPARCTASTSSGLGSQPRS